MKLPFDFYFQMVFIPLMFLFILFSPTLRCFICPTNERAISLNFILSKLKRNFPWIKQTEQRCT